MSHPKSFQKSPRVIADSLYLGPRACLLAQVRTAPTPTTAGPMSLPPAALRASVRCFPGQSQRPERRARRWAGWASEYFVRLRDFVWPVRAKIGRLIGEMGGAALSRTRWRRGRAGAVGTFLFVCVLCLCLCLRYVHVHDGRWLVVGGWSLLFRFIKQVTDSSSSFTALGVMQLHPREFTLRPPPPVLSKCSSELRPTAPDSGGNNSATTTTTPHHHHLHHVAPPPRATWSNTGQGDVGLGQCGDLRRGRLGRGLWAVGDAREEHRCAGSVDR